MPRLRPCPAVRAVRGVGGSAAARRPALGTSSSPAMQADPQLRQQYTQRAVPPHLIMSSLAPLYPPTPRDCRYETTKAADAVAALKAALKPLATCKRDGKWQTMDATTLVPGDLVLLAAGAAVPADCIVNEGRIEVDQAALTGESLPVTMYKGDTPKMGSTSACMGAAGWAG